MIAFLSARAPCVIPVPAGGVGSDTLIVDPGDKLRLVGFPPGKLFVIFNKAS